MHFLLDESWEQLPTIVEEGLCTYLETELVPESGTTVRAMRLLYAADYLGVGELSLQFSCQPEAGGSVSGQAPFEVVKKSPHSGTPMVALSLNEPTLDLLRKGSVGQAHYGFGMWVVERIAVRNGLPMLHTLCERAKADGHLVIPPAELLRAAGLDGEESWKREILKRIDARVLEAAALHIRDALADTAIAFHNGTPESLRDGWLDRSQLLFRLEANGQEVSLLDLDGFKEVLVERLP